MDIYMLLFRLIHIFSGVFWVGSAMLLAFFIAPALARTKDTTLSNNLYNNTAFMKIFPVVAVGTIISGIALYIKVSDTFNIDWITTTNGLVLTIGGLAGIGAAGHGGASLGPANEKYAEIVKQIGNGQPTAEQSKQLADLQEYLTKHTNISLIMMVVALFGMTTFRYF